MFKSTTLAIITALLFSTASMTPAFAQGNNNGGNLQDGGNGNGNNGCGNGNGGPNGSGCENNGGGNGGAGGSATINSNISNSNDINNRNRNTVNSTNTNTNTNANTNENTQSLDNVNLNVQSQNLNNRNYNEDTNNNQDTVTNTNRNAQRQRQGQEQGQDQNQGQGQDQGQAQSVENVGNVNIENPRQPVNTAYAAPLVSGEDTCMGSSSVGAQGVTFGLSIGTTWTDDNCRRLKNSRQLVALGFHRAAIALMCVDEDVKKSMDAAGTPCPSANDQKVVAPPTPITPPTATMEPIPNKAPVVKRKSHKHYSPK